MYGCVQPAYQPLDHLNKAELTACFQLQTNLDTPAQNALHSRTAHGFFIDYFNMT